MASARAPAPPERLTDAVRHADALRLFSRERLWELFDGQAQGLNIGHECLDRHPPRRIAVRIARADGTRTAHTFGALARASARCAHWLQAQGVRPGDRVAIMLEPSLAFYAALFGAVKAGAIAVPLFTLFGPEALRLRVGDCTPRLLLLDPTLPQGPQLGQAAQAAVPGLQIVVADADFLRALRRFPAAYTPQTAANDLAIFQYTSGTTRELPEAVRHTQRAVVTVMVAALYGTGVRPGDRFCCPASPAWGQGLWHGTIAPLALGVTVGAWAGPFDPAGLLRALRDWRITNLAAAATHYRFMKNCGQAGQFPWRLRKMSFTGEPIDEETRLWAEATFGSTLCSMYGTTEVGVILANYPGAPDFAVKPGALGRPVPGVEVAVLDPADHPCPPGVVGEIKVRRRDGWFATKDRGHTDADGYFFHDGRADDVIISAGYTLSAVEIENELLAHPGIAEAAVIAVPDDQRGQVAKAFLVPLQAAAPPPAAEMQDWVRTRLGRHEYPRQVVYVEALPKTPAGKVNRKVLRDREARQPS